eukprot:15449969-Alexandrium_andersonii.AAC.1
MHQLSCELEPRARTKVPQPGRYSVRSVLSPSCSVPSIDSVRSISRCVAKGLPRGGSAPPDPPEKRLRRARRP